jgi:hypothetical protein
MRWFLSRAILAVLLVGPAATPPVHATDVFETGNDLLEKCQRQSHDFENGVCLGFIVGVADAIAAVRPRGGMVGGWRACPASDVTSGQVRDVVVGFLTGHPELTHRGAATLAAHALAEAFPCPPE